MKLLNIFSKTEEGSTEKLLQFSSSYFLLYVLTGYFAKYFEKVLGVTSIQYTFYNTIGGMLVCNLIIFFLGWYKFKSTDYIKFLGISMPREFLYIIPSGIFTAIIIPTTTLMYTLPISVMVAMIIMRASIIIISRIIDQIQIYFGILHKKVYWEENIAIIFALLAVSIKMFYVKPGDFDFLHNKTAMIILSSYLISYSFRIYIMNYYKNTRKKGAIYDTKGFFSIEQISSTLAILLAGFIFFKVVNKPVETFFTTNQEVISTQNLSIEKISLLKSIEEAKSLIKNDASKFSSEEMSKMENTINISYSNLKKEKNIEKINETKKDLDKGIKLLKKKFSYEFSECIKDPTPRWFEAILSGLPFGLSAFFSVFLFMFKGRTATFAGLVNRLTSLIAGTTSTIIVYFLIKGQKPPQKEDWIGLLLIFIALYFTGKAEKKRSIELSQNK